MANVAINGLGRIGRAAFKIILERPELNLVAVNDLIPAENLAYLLKYDSVYGIFEASVGSREDALVVNGKEFRLLHEKDPAKLPWKDMDVDLVFECTGIFTNREGMQKHREAGAKRVILSAPTKGEDVATVVFGVNNSEHRQDEMLSTASCTTNSLTPVFEILSRRIGVKKALMSTIHAYTSTQEIVDGPNRHIRRGRAAAVNIVPTSTGAAIATTKALPQFKGKFDGVSLRVPVPVGSISDITFLTERETSVEEVNRVLSEEAETDRYRDVIVVTDEPIVSSDIIRNPAGSIVDLEMTRVVDGDLVKVMAWYDNEWGYANQMIREAADMLG